MIQIQKATLSDLESILHLTNQEIVNGTAFWMTTPRSYQEQMTWFTACQKANLPILIARNQNQNVLGYASYGPFRAYDGYKHTVEHSLYIDPSAQRQGIGKRLLEKLMHCAKANQVHVMVACIAENNIASIKLHEGLDFKVAGVLPEIGIKFNKWLNLLFMYKILTPNDSL
ncbi:L-methionine sulfoximine/L-methionine sulfone acetyltransferase [Commensalibacter sp. Nvir]|uniref:GNAT family N-acetyltransferase n=1 Tax=Commensalibacter sp. Nvir TaxID=3069817 RepID=UPI002D524FCC|nr:L-methionine sulfoximine/L-methionine sulfone acetyltransferase [Commensalibacter sp. Nvir]